jgi:hypothetical protein
MRIKTMKEMIFSYNLTQKTMNLLQNIYKRRRKSKRLSIE